MKVEYPELEEEERTRKLEENALMKKKENEYSQARYLSLAIMLLGGVAGYLVAEGQGAILALANILPLTLYLEYKIRGQIEWPFRGIYRDLYGREVFVAIAVYIMIAVWLNIELLW